MTGSVCSIAGCGKAHDARGWCKSHYKRWLRHGTPLGGGPARGYAQAYFRDVVLSYDGDDCLVWPYNRSKDGYPAFGMSVVAPGVRSTHVGRVLCAEVNGPPPTPDHEAAHTCGGGRNGCVTRAHLVWKTSAENEADKIRHDTVGRGERNPSARLNPDQVREIRNLSRTVSQTAIASLYGVSRATVGEIVRGSTWAWLDAHP